MKSITFTACAILLFFSAGAYAQSMDKADNQHGPDQSVAVDMGYSTMENGSIIYEENAPSQTAAKVDQAIQDIAPAAGGQPVVHEAPKFKYDPVTQTYRRVAIDKDGNTGQDVINTAR